MHIAFAWWSTWWHVFPIRSLIQYTQVDDKINTKYTQLFWFGEAWSLEEQVCQWLQSDIKNLTFVPIIAGKLRRSPNRKEWWNNIIDIFKLVGGILQSGYKLIIHRIDVVVCKGGYVSLPVTIAGWLLGKRIVVHESDTVPGLSTRRCSRLATQVFCGFEGVLGGIYVGQILSDDLCIVSPPLVNRDHTYLLITGGSQWSQSLYTTIAQLWKQHPERSDFFHVTIILGTANQDLRNMFIWLTCFEVIDFADQTTMGQLYLRSDISITRGGTTSLVEQQLFGVRMLMVPIPRTHDQLSNCQYFQHHYGHHLCIQDDSLADTLGQYLTQYLHHRKDIPDMSHIAKTITATKAFIRSTLLWK